MSERMQKRELYGAVAGVALLAFAMAWRWLFPWLERIDWSRPPAPVVEAVPERVKELAAQAQQPAPDVIDDEPAPAPVAEAPAAPAVQPEPAAAPVAAAASRPVGASPAARAPATTNRRPNRPRGAPQSLEETLEILGASQLSIDNGRGERVVIDGRARSVEPQSSTFSKLLDRLSEKLRK